MGKTQSKRMTVARLAEAGDVGVESIRYYQRRGLIEVPSAASGYRHYNAAHVERLRFIRRAQSVGFALDEIGELLRLNDMRDHKVARHLAEGKIADIETRIAHLESMVAALRHLVGTCHHAGEDMPCPIIRMALNQESECGDERQTARAKRHAGVLRSRSSSKSSTVRAKEKR